MCIAGKCTLQVHCIPTSAVVSSIWVCATKLKQNVSPVVKNLSSTYLFGNLHSDTKRLAAVQVPQSLMSVCRWANP